MGNRCLVRSLILAAVVLVCIWTVAGAALVPSSAVDGIDTRVLAAGEFATSDNTGTINVRSDPLGAGFTITGAAPYSGTTVESGWSVDDAPVGEYTITWHDIDGYTKPSSATDTLDFQGDVIDFHGEYEEEKPPVEVGTIYVNSTPTEATYTVSGPGGYSHSGTTNDTVSNAPVGSYTITWGDMPGHTKPSSGGAQILVANGAITFTGTYTAQAGTITVTSLPTGAPFAITGTASYSGTTDTSFSGALPGPYTITWGAMEGYTAPASQTLTLAEGSSIAFIGNYSSGVGTISVTSTPTGATFSISGAAEYSGTAPWSKTDAPVGSYTITWGAMTGYGTPASQTQTLTAGGTIAFAGTYVDNVGPVISGVSFGEVGTISCNITWTTDEASDTLVKYGPNIYYGTTTTLNTAMVKSHRVTLTGLKQASTYHFCVVSKDAAGNESVSVDFEFTTLDDTPPVIVTVIATDISSVSATIRWETDERSDSQVEYGLTANYGMATTVDPSWLINHSVSLTGLTPQTTYHYRVKSTDGWANSTYSVDATFSTTDINAPVISEVTAASITDTSVIITWLTDSASESSVEYGLSTSYGFTATPDTNLVTSHSIAISDLVAQTTYHFKVKSRDASGLWAESPDYTFITGVDMGPDAPKILFLSPGAPSSSEVTISWSTSEMATAQVEYGLTEQYGAVTQPDGDYDTSHYVKLTGLKSGATYHFRVISVDGAGNRTVSQDKTFSTPIGDAPIPSLPTWVWAIVGVGGALLVGTLVLKNR